LHSAGVEAAPLTGVEMIGIDGPQVVPSDQLATVDGDLADSDNEANPSTVASTPLQSYTSTR